MPADVQLAYLALLCLFLLTLAYQGLARWVAEAGRRVLEREGEKAIHRFRIRTNRFKLARKLEIQDALMQDGEVLRAIVEHSKEEGVSLGEAETKALIYIDEIVPAFNILSYYKLGRIVSDVGLNFLYKLAVDRRELPEDPHEFHEKNVVVYVFNHRSNVDYILAAYALLDNVAISYAVGEWARVWPLEGLFKSFGSYFLRRNFRDPKVGVLDALIACAADPALEKDILFVPGAVNFDRVLEDRALIAESRGEKRRASKADLFSRTMKILFSNSYKFMRRRLRKNGYASVRFGKPVSLRAYLSEQGEDILRLERTERLARVKKFADHIMREIADLMPASPVPVVAAALLAQGAEATSRAALRAQAEDQLERLGKRGTDLIGFGDGLEAGLSYGLELLEMRGVLSLDGERIRVREEERDLLRYYYYSIAHLLGDEVGYSPPVVSEDRRAALAPRADPA